MKLRIAKILLGAVFGFFAVTALPVLAFRVVNPPTTPLMWIRWAESGYDSAYPLRLRQWTPLRGISPHLMRAVILSEDQKFFAHNGFDWDAVETAVKHNMESESKIGASTISMQTARNVFLWQSRTWPRKVLEAYFTFLMEAAWPKERILEVYFNVIEWGDGVFGCTAASQTYFHHTPRTISPLESAWLAAVLPNPREWAAPKPPKYVETRQARILGSMHRVRLPDKLLKKT